MQEAPRTEGTCSYAPHRTTPGMANPFPPPTRPARRRRFLCIGAPSLKSCDSSPAFITDVRDLLLGPTHSRVNRLLQIL